MNVKEVNIIEIMPYYNNPRNNLKAIKPTAESLKRFGFTKPIIVEQNNVIIAGHTRYQAAIQLGLDKVPIIVSDMDEEQAKQYRIADNKLAEKSFFDESALLDELKSFDMPSDMQDFFFEDLSAMLDFKAFSPVDNSFYDYDTQHETQATEHSDSNADEQADSTESEEEVTDDEPDILLREPFKPYFENGQKVMDTICPFCGYKEKMILQ